MIDFNLIDYNKNLSAIYLITQINTMLLYFSQLHNHLIVKQLQTF